MWKILNRSGTVAMSVLTTLLLTSCGSLFNSAVKSLPSVQNCQKVVYKRTGNQVTINAECEIPIDDSSLLTKAIAP
jgi:archaellum component FlaF (FlaF/FlaG flagellin family)